MKEIIIAMISAMAMLLAVVLKWWLDKRKQEKRSIGKYLQKIHQIYALLNTALAELQADRLLLLVAENGGGIPRPGSQVYSSVLWESFSPSVNTFRDFWQKRPIDSQYAGLLDAVFSKGEVSFDVSDIEGGFIKDLYVANGVTHVKKYRIFVDQYKFIYLSINFSHGEINTPQINVVVQTLVNKLHSLVSDVGDEVSQKRES